MIIIKKHEKSDPATFTHTFRGQEITLTVRPLDSAEVQKLLKKHTTYVFGKADKVSPLERVPVTDSVALGKDLMDHLLVGFTGFGTDADTPLPVTRENKLLIVNLEPGEGEKPLHEVIQDKARELAAIVEAEEKEQAKN
jgi:hypothetical protein